MSKPQVLIVGAGPTGLVLALWLARRKIAVRIIDKTAEPGTASRALAVQVRTLEFYRQLHIADGLIAGGVKIEGLNLWVKGKRAARIPFGRIGEGQSPYPFVLVSPQDEHERYLSEQLAAAGVYVERQTELLHFAASEQGVRAVLRVGGGAEEICEADYLAGCDGARSTVREQLGVGFPGGTYEHLFYVADVQAAGPPTDGELHIDLEDADFLLVFPLQGKGRLRLVGAVRQAADSDHAELTFDDVRGKALDHLQLDVQRVNWFSTYHVHHRVARRFRDGRVFLLGDAAHIHSPVGGQGMNTGIGDAVNLAWKLAAVLQQEAAARLLDSYETERIGFANRLVATTDRLFTVVTKRGGAAKAVRTWLVPWLAPLVFRRKFARRFLFRTASQIGVRYRDSPLSRGRAGDVHGGDRLPWVETGPGGDNFAPLDSLAWQVHVYGEPRPGVSEACDRLRLPLHGFAWRPAMGRAGLRESALYLVRPDGYVGLADGQGDAETLQQYFTEYRG